MPAGGTGAIGRVEQVVYPTAGRLIACVCKCVRIKARGCACGSIWGYLPSRTAPRCAGLPSVALGGARCVELPTRPGACAAWVPRLLCPRSVPCANRSPVSSYRAVTWPSALTAQHRRETKTADFPSCDFSRETRSNGSLSSSGLKRAPSIFLDFVQSYGFLKWLILVPDYAELELTARFSKIKVVSLRVTFLLFKIIICFPFYPNKTAGFDLGVLFCDRAIDAKSAR